MPQSYLETCILDALKRARGNQTRARQFIAAMAVEDDQLLLALARPHLAAIVAHAVNRIAIQKKRSGGTQQDQPPSAPAGKGEESGFGLDLLKALGGPNVAKFGKEEASPPIAKKKASQQHINALRTMAAKAKNKPK